MSGPNTWLFRRRVSVDPATDRRGRQLRFAVFAGTGSAEGGWNDFDQAFTLRRSALSYARSLIDLHHADWAHVVDLLALEIITEDD